MDFAYLSARVICAIFIVMLLVVCFSPIYIIAVQGVDESTHAMLFTGAVFFPPLLGFILSFKYMGKHHKDKTRLKAFSFVMFMLLALFGFSLWAEHKNVEFEKMKKEALQLEYEKMKLEYLEGMLKDPAFNENAVEKKTLDVSETSK